ncbi:hypothetical protein BGX27_010223 [Mortierella sp. AM989]|nr:hypothetical protein BGX27_010223 [Mortierella sp. AM989]
MTQSFPLISWCRVPFPFRAPHPASSPFLIQSTSSFDVASSCTATIFEIPLIVDLICTYLTPKEIWNCYRVNTTWNGLFGIHRYRDVRFADTSSGQSWDILENSYRIRNLKIDMSEGALFFNNPSLSWPTYKARSVPRCTNLQELACVDLKYLCDCPEIHLWWCSARWDDVFTSALDLIHQNPMLKRLEIDVSWFENGEDVLNAQILRTLSGMRFLEYIKIKVRAREQILKILESLPASTQDLELYAEDFDDHDFIQDFTTIQAQSVRKLSVRGTIIWHIGTILPLFPLLENVVLSVPDGGIEDQVISALTAHCPKIHSIQILDFCYLISTLVDAYPNGLRSFHAPLLLDHGGDALVMKALLRHSVNTLETLHMSCYFPRISAEIGVLLRSCPNLKVVELKFGSPGIKKTKGMALRDLLYEKDSTNYPSRTSLGSAMMATTHKHTPWACRNLEELHLSISDTSGPIGKVPLEEKKIWTARQIGLLYQELRSLKRLTNLHLNWKCRKNDQGDKLAHETGLRIMNQYGQPQQYRMSRSDLIWMNIHWPTLAEIEENEVQEQLCAAADREFARENMSRQHWYDVIPRSCICPRRCDDLCYSWTERLEPEDWPCRVNKKRQRKAGQPFRRKPLNDTPAWVIAEKYYHRVEYKYKRRFNKM